VEKIIGVGRYDVPATEPGTRRSAEAAFAVLDEHQGRGLVGASRWPDTIGGALLANLKRGLRQPTGD
jgi:hypothetical protein